MCLGLPGRVVALAAGGRLGQVEVAGAIRLIDLSLLPAAPAPGDYLLVHSGIALELMPPEQAREVAAWFSPAPVADAPVVDAPVADAPVADAPVTGSAPEPGTGPVQRDEGTQQQ
jgi:hydrogenase assembly chaperone HypC/HupF